MIPLPLLIFAMFSLLCVFACLFCLIQGLSYLFQPEDKKPRLYGLKMIGTGLLFLLLPTALGYVFFRQFWMVP